MQMIHLIIVEAFDWGQVHLAVTCRELNHRGWHNFLIRKPTWVVFGDRMVFYPPSGKLYLERGPNLRYRCRLDTVPAKLLQFFIDTCPIFGPDIETDDYSGGLTV